MPKLAGENCPVSRQHRSSIGSSITSFIIKGGISDINIFRNIEAVKILCYRNYQNFFEHLSKILGNYFLVVYARHIWMSFIILSVLIHRYCGKRYNLGKSAGLVAEMMRLPSYLNRYVPNVSSIILSDYTIDNGIRSQQQFHFRALLCFALYVSCVIYHYHNVDDGVCYGKDK